MFLISFPDLQKDSMCLLKGISRFGGGVFVLVFNSVGTWMINM